MPTLRSIRAVMRKFDRLQPYWEDAAIELSSENEVSLVTYWKNPELYGLWEFRYSVTLRCFGNLIERGLIEQEASSVRKNKGAILYRLSPQGRKWPG